MEYGWVPEPSGRGTWSILWSCIATMFICTWTVLHLDVPKPGHNWQYVEGRKILSMFVALIAPELFLGKSVQSFYCARAWIKFLRENGYSGWTLAHAEFVDAKGFYIDTLEGKTSLCSSDELQNLIVAGRMDGPPISEDELKSRGKSDSMIKLVAILQIIWFAVQTLVRAIGHRHITAIEIMTVAFVFCSTFTYGFCWHRPQNVEHPIVLQIKDVAVADGHMSKVIRPSLHQSLLEDKATNAGFTLMFLFATAFGAIHCLAWNSPFPSPEERLAWRVCSVASTALPVLTNLTMLPMMINWNAYVPETHSYWLHYPLLVLYFIARIIIIVLAFMSLRALPGDAYETVNWNNYVPHFV